MGFDLYGIKPHNPDNLVKPEIDYDIWKTLSEEEQQKHWDADTEYHNAVPGEYFRNNCWWWRPLWDYTCQHAGELLNDKDKEYGHSNDFHAISSKKANYIGIKLLDLVNSGHAKEYEEEYMKDYNIAKEHNKEIEKACEILHEIVKAKLESETSVAPINYPEKEKADWDELQGQKNWSSSYPFDTDNVKEFSHFCLESGGFKIG
tara:strand:- start:766 stop:1377 length:612 start_codon:yes stop_codon:yes gene_type:complete